MPDYSDLDPSLLKASISYGDRLKESITTELYTTGTPTAANQIQRSIMYEDGTLKESIATATGLKASWLLSGAAPVASTGDTYQFAIIADQQASGTSGGAPSLAWETRDLNTELSDVDGIVSIATNQFTLQAGTYAIRAWMPSLDTEGDQTRLYNITDTAVSALGMCTHTGATARGGMSMIDASITIAGATVFEIQHRNTTSYTHGYGFATSWGTEQYTTVSILKVT